MRRLIVTCFAVLAVPASLKISSMRQPSISSTPPTEYRLLKLEGNDVSWYAPARPRLEPITYAFVKERRTFYDARNCGAMEPPSRALEKSRIDEADFRREVRKAFAMWANVAAIEFREIAEPEKAGILIGAQAEPRGRAFTNVATQSPGSPAITQSLICLNPEKHWKIGFDGNLDVYDIRYTLAHEIGHAIGLDHPGREGQLMSYRYSETNGELTPGDVAGAVAIYGARGFPAFAGRRAPTEEATLAGAPTTSLGLAEPARP